MRERQRWTQTDLARTLRAKYGLLFHQQTVQRVEAGERPVRLKKVHLIAELFGVDLGSVTAETGTARAVDRALKEAATELEQRVHRVEEMLLWHARETATIYAKARDAWDAYVQRQDRAGQPVDEELVAKVDVVDGTYERARHMCSRDLAGPGPDAIG